MKKFLCYSCESLVSVSNKEDKCPNCGAKLWKSREMKGRKWLKGKAWSSFSKYIRLRDSIKTTGTTTHCVCYTCKKTEPLKKIQAGHLSTGRNDDVLFDEDYVRGQCVACNVFCKGRQGDFAIEMIKELHNKGLSYEEAVDEVSKTLAASGPGASSHINDEELASIYFRYERKCKELMKANGDKNDSSTI